MTTWRKRRISLLESWLFIDGFDGDDTLSPSNWSSVTHNYNWEWRNANVHTLSKARIYYPVNGSQNKKSFSFIVPFLSLCWPFYSHSYTDSITHSPTNQPTNLLQSLLLSFTNSHIWTCISFFLGLLAFLLERLDLFFVFQYIYIYINLLMVRLHKWLLEKYNIHATKWFTSLSGCRPSLIIFEEKHSSKLLSWSLTHVYIILHHILFIILLSTNTYVVLALYTKSGYYATY